MITGIPPPRVTWSRGGRLIDDTFAVLSNGTVRNEITFRTIDRDFLHAELTCTATNTNLTRPVTNTVHVDMNCKCPLSNPLLGTNQCRKNNDDFNF